MTVHSSLQQLPLGLNAIYSGKKSKAYTGELLLEQRLGTALGPLSPSKAKLTWQESTWHMYLPSSLQHQSTLQNVRSFNPHNCPLIPMPQMGKLRDGAGTWACPRPQKGVCVRAGIRTQTSWLPGTYIEDSSLSLHSSWPALLDGSPFSLGEVSAGGSFL